MKTKAAFAIVLGLLLLLGSKVRAQSLTRDDICELLLLGYPEEEIKKEAKKAGISFKMDKDTIRTLEKAGAGENLISFLEKLSARPSLNLETIVSMAESGASTGKILDKIASAWNRKLSKEEEAKLKKKNIPFTVILALRARPVTLQDLEALVEKGCEVSICRKLISITGNEKRKIPPKKALELEKKGIPRELLGLFIEKRRGKGKAERKYITIKKLDTGVYSHVGKRFTVRCPKTWFLAKDIHDGYVRYLFTPEKGLERIEDADTGILLYMAVPPEGTVWRNKTNEELLRQLLPWIRMDQPGMKPDGKIKVLEIGGIQAAMLPFSGRMKEKAGEYKCYLYMARKDGIIFQIVAFAPKDDFENVKPVYEKVLKESDFRRQGHASRVPEIPSFSFVEKYKEAVVYVEASSGLNQGQGTGVIISRHGYVLTNHHVVWNEEKGKYHDEIIIRWDNSLRKREVKARVIKAFRRESAETLAGGMIGGIDMALLKLPFGDYKAMPISPISNVKLGDPVVTLGFPKSFSVTGLSLFLTKGVVVRFNRNVYGNIESITTDAKITHGSSGGPCVDLKTGGVIGLNSWAYPIGSKTDAGRDANDFVGYYFLCPIDYALALFPLVADLGMRHDEKLDFISSYELASLFLSTASKEAALAMAERAVELEPRSIDALILRSLCQRAVAYEKLAQGKGLEARKMMDRAEVSLEKALVFQPKNKDALIAMGMLLFDLGKLEAASKYVRSAIKEYPREWSAYMLEAKIDRARKKYGEALRNLEKAKELSMDLVPDPYLLAGAICYEKEWLEEGKREFEKALEIHPDNLNARLGAADYFLKKERYDEAISSYSKIKADFPRNPIPLYKIGICYRRKKDDIEALKNFRDAKSLFTKGNIVPPKDFYLEYAAAYKATDRGKGEVNCYARYLLHFGKDKDAIDVNLKAAMAFKEAGLHECATLHVSRAKELAKEFKVKIDTSDFVLKDPGLADIVYLLAKVYYPTEVVVDLVLCTRLSYRLLEMPDKKFKAEVKRLLEIGVPKSVLRAILKSNKKFPAKKAAAAPKAVKGNAIQGKQNPAGGPPVPPPAPSAVPRALIGSWYLRTIDQFAGKIEVVMTFFPNGKLTIKGSMGSFMVDDMGSYTVSGDKMSTIMQKSTNPFAVGQKKTYTFSIQGSNVLRMYDPELKRWTVFTRVRGR